MGWQEEISGLDADVAVGRISAEEYRSRRDELLSRPDAGAADANPFPPPFRWGGAHRADTAHTSYIPVVTDDVPPDVPDAVPTATPTTGTPTTGTPTTGSPTTGQADRTQLVRPAPTPTTGPAVHADSTQIVRPSPGPSTTAPDADSTQLVRPGTGATMRDADRTQLVRAGGPAPGPSTPAGTQPSRPDGTSPPWHHGDEFTPHPGSDPFEQFRTRGKRGWVKPTVAAVAAVAVIALVVVLVLVRNDSSTGAAPTSEASTTTAAPTTTTTTQAPVIASLPGTQLLDRTFATFADLRRAKVLSPEELAALEPAKPLGTHLRVNQDGQTVTTVWTCTVDGDPSTVVGRLTSRSAGSGFVPVRPPFADVAALQQLPASGKAGPGALRASYSNGDVVVHVESRGTDPTAAVAAFRAVLGAELASLPSG